MDLGLCLTQAAPLSSCTHQHVSQELCYWGSSLKESLKRNLLPSLHVLEKAPHSQLEVVPSQLEVVPNRSQVASLEGNRQFLPDFCPGIPEMTPFLLQRDKKTAAEFSEKDKASSSRKCS